MTTGRESRKFPIKPAARSAAVFACGFIFGLGGLLAFYITIIDGMGWLFASTFLPLIVVFAIVAMATRKTCFEISNKGLEITGDWAGETVPWRDLDVENARIVQFAAEPGLRPKWRTVGLAMPGYCSGWFRLYNKSKALAFLTSKEEAVCIPTCKDYVILLSAADNPGLLAALQQWGRTPSSRRGLPS